ncbi:DUF697 domain-containing protein [Alginatibacterium sediminis]|uniref:DUF697 domain-containing protein n=1 Tax=Alginatibacterium sediminis TaxID=2164068 RepID=A0A420ECT1_9ALTE|nr:TIGR01620 family protein [Alginatibacterium sediminis]RKF18471.1 DUF697 domain-containing protein [Alginatibacterium sediminis]
MTDNKNDPYFVALDETIETAPESLSDGLDLEDNPRQFKLERVALKGMRTFARLFFLLLFSFAAWELWQMHVFLSAIHWGLSLALWLLLALLGLYTLQVFRSLRASMNDGEQINSLQTQAKQLQSQRQVGGSKHYVSSLEKLYQGKPQAELLTQTLALIQDYHDDREVLHIIDAHVMQPLDEQALAVVSRYSKRTGVMVAISPLVIADLLLALLNSFRMVDELAQIYGIRPSFLGRIKLSRMIVKHLAWVGVSEIGSDMVADVSSGLLGNASSRAAQGIGVGLYNARIGIQTMRVCRPIPFTQEQRPKLKQAIQGISSFIGKQLDKPKSP